MITFKSTGLPRIIEDLEKMPDILRLDDGLGVQILDVITAGIVESANAQQSPDGTPWKPLSEKYAEWKAFQFPGQEMGHLYDVMLSPDEIAGERAVSFNRAYQAYGRSQQAIDEIAWFEDGGREFFGISEAAAGGCDEKVTAVFYAKI